MTPVWWFFLGFFSGIAVECYFSVRYLRKVKKNVTDIQKLADELNRGICAMWQMERTLDDKLKDEQTPPRPRFHLVDPKQFD